MTRTPCQIFWCILLAAGVSYAQSVEPIAADRPDQTESAFLVPAGSLQFETGLAFEREDEHTSGFSLPGFLARYAVDRHIELRLAAEVVSHSSFGSHRSGLTPLAIGTKLHLVEEHGLIPQTVLLAHLSLPGLASSVFRASRAAPSFRFSMQHSLDDQLSLGYNIGAEWDGFSPDPIPLYTCSVGIAVSGQVGVFGEVYGFLPHVGGTDHRADAGLTLLLSPTVMIDLSGGIGLSTAAPGGFIALGCSYRIDSQR